MTAEANDSCCCVTVDVPGSFDKHRHVYHDDPPVERSDVDTASTLIFENVYPDLVAKVTDVGHYASSEKLTV